MSHIVEFLENKRPDVEGRMLADMLENNFDWMLHTDNYIQWFFPLKELSDYNPDAPILTNEDIREIKEKIQKKEEIFYFIFKTVDKYLRFLGIQDVWIFDTFDRFELTEYFEERRWLWMETPMHTHLQISRLFNFLRLIGWNHYGTQLLDFMKEVAKENNVVLNVNSMDHWEDAVEHHKRIQ